MTVNPFRIRAAQSEVLVNVSDHFTAVNSSGHVEPKNADVPIRAQIDGSENKYTGTSDGWSVDQGNDALTIRVKLPST
jgi:hypothetical protein